jgi:hypothetical protein
MAISSTERRSKNVQVFVEKDAVQRQLHGFGTYMLMLMILIVKQAH